MSIEPVNNIESLPVPKKVAKSASKLKAVPPKEAEPSKPKILIYGRPGVGKTFTSLDFPACFYIDSEGGASRSHYTDKLKASGGVYLGKEQGSNDFSTVIEQVQALAIEKHSYKTLIIDSFTKLYNIATFEAAEKGGDEYGRDKKEANKPTRRLMNWLDRIDMNVILIAHEKSMWGLDATGKRAEIGSTFDGYDKMEYDLDLVINIIKNGPSRIAKIAKSRLLGFPETTSFPWSYEEFANRYGKDVIEKEGKQIILATNSQLSEIQALLKTVRIPEKEIDKWLKGAGADSWEEMDSDKLAGTIAFIRKSYLKPEGEKA